MTEKKDNLSLTRDEIDALGFDEWIDYIRRYDEKWDLNNSHPAPPSSEECLQIIRKGWEGGSDDAAEALIELAKIMRGSKTNHLGLAITAINSATQLINCLIEDPAELQFEYLIKDKERDADYLKDWKKNLKKIDPQMN